MEVKTELKLRDWVKYDSEMALLTSKLSCDDHRTILQGQKDWTVEVGSCIIDSKWYRTRSLLSSSVRTLFLNLWFSKSLVEPSTNL